MGRGGCLGELQWLLSHHGDSLAHLSLVWQCLQQKQELWKTNLSATRRSMGYTVFWQAVHISFTCAFRLKDWPRAEQRETEDEEGVWDNLDPSIALHSPEPWGAGGSPTSLTLPGPLH